VPGLHFRGLARGRPLARVSLPSSTWSANTQDVSRETSRLANRLLTLSSAGASAMHGPMTVASTPRQSRSTVAHPPDEFRRSRRAAYPYVHTELLRPHRREAPGEMLRSFTGGPSCQHGCLAQSAPGRAPPCVPQRSVLQVPRPTSGNELQPDRSIHLGLRADDFYQQ